jgi:hypothetical protein
MLNFVKGSDLVHSERLESVDPLTLETYRELLRNNRSLIFSMLVCRHSRNIYLAKNILSIRYEVEHKTSIYMMRDPITRSEVDDVLFYEVEESPLFGGMAEGGTGSQEAEREADIDIEARFIGSELDMMFSVALKERIFRHAGEPASKFTTFLVAGIVLVVFFAVIYACLLLFSFLFVLLSAK